MKTGTEQQMAERRDQSEPDRPEPDFGELLSDEFSVAEPRSGDLCKGVVIDVDESGLLVDFGFKREGFVPAEDLDGLDEDALAAICPGAEVPVFVVRPRTRDGQPELSIKQAQQYEHWLKAEELMASNGLYEGEVAGCNRGGLIVKYGDIRGFVPTSQVVGMPRRLPEEERRKRLDAMVGRQIGLRVIEVDRARRRLIFSQRRAYREWQERRREKTMAELTEGETRRGRVTDLTSFGAFVDLGGADGLVHVSELSWRRVNHPREVLSVGQDVDVYVLGVDRKRKRIALSLKRLEPDPWSVVDEEYQVGQLVEGRVTRVLDFGAFVALDLGIEGLLHVSEMIGTPELQPADIVQPKDVVVLKIIRIESNRKRIGLSAKQVRQSEWERWMVDQQAMRLAEKATKEAEAAEGRATEPSREPGEGPAVGAAAVPDTGAGEVGDRPGGAAPVAVADERAESADADAAEPEAVADAAPPAQAAATVEAEKAEVEEAALPAAAAHTPAAIAPAEETQETEPGATENQGAATELPVGEEGPSEE